VTISKHALEQYMIKVFSITNLSNVKEKTKQKAIKAIEENVKKGIEIELSKKESTIRLLKSLPKRKSTVKTRQVDEEEERDGIEIYNFLNEDEEDESENIGEDEEYL
jgi:hypothetical protein